MYLSSKPAGERIACSWECVLSKLDFEVRAVAGGGAWRADLVSWLDGAMQTNLLEMEPENSGSRVRLEFLVGARCDRLVKAIDDGRTGGACCTIVVGPHFDPQERAELLLAGADDVMDFATDPEELVARVGAIGRRYVCLHDCAALGGHVWEGAQSDAFEARVPYAQLTRREQDILNDLLSAGGEIVRYDNFCGSRDAPAMTARQLHYHVTSIRRKTGRLYNIENIRGIGYRMTAQRLR